MKELCLFLMIQIQVIFGSILVILELELGIWGLLIKLSKYLCPLTPTMQNPIIILESLSFEKVISIKQSLISSTQLICLSFLSLAIIQHYCFGREGISKSLLKWFRKPLLFSLSTMTQKNFTRT